ncbi:hypothetical protein E1B28_003826 [Marasmius oreades]|uniref:Uncharacterized protein n=1 Tax=Marasmius oreades TaxID=181124 RepID=A0A9P7UXC0_9AGAR|nr:uncharacterized protein E1B28_003826 [Marasmius oreades]KAG7096382.1 hypothetical protein E1B28_003826 [Marasmius oreades]
MKDAITVPDDERVAEYYKYRQELERMAADFRLVITHPSYALPHLKPGRLIKVKHDKLDFGWGVVISYSKRISPKHLPLPPHEQYIIDVLLNVIPSGTLMTKDRANVPPTPGNI